jgi:DNA primase
MGTALTEHHLGELVRLTKRLYLCFDADAAGEDATLRGMERAHGQGFEIRVVVLPPGQDPADAPDGFEQRLAQAESYLHYRVRLELERTDDRQEAFVRAREILAKAEDSPERQEAVRLLADRLDLPRETLSGIAPARGVSPGGSSGQPQKLLDAGIRLEREALAAVVAHPDLVDALAGLGEEHFDLEEHRRMRAALIARVQPDSDLVPLLAELDATASSEGITRRTGTEMLLRLRESKLRRDLQGQTDLARVTELQAHLAKVRQALTELA